MPLAFTQEDFLVACIFWRKSVHGITKSDFWTSVLGFKDYCCSYSGALDFILLSVIDQIEIRSLKTS